MERIKHSPEAADRLIEIAGKLDAEATVVLAGVHAEETKRLAAELSKLAGPQLRIEDDLAAPLVDNLPKVLPPEWIAFWRRPGRGVWPSRLSSLWTPEPPSRLILWMAKAPSTAAIAPGLRLMLDALAEGTDALPSITFQSPSDDDPFGADTESAMRLGVHLAARGLINQAIERYALAYGVAQSPRHRR